MRKPIRKAGALLVAALATSAFVVAHVRLIYSGNGTPLFWSVGPTVSIVINATGSGDITDDSHFTALRNAIATWNAVPQTGIKLLEDQTPSEQASVDWASSNRHLVLFDETNSTGYFPAGSGLVAITPLSFFLNGQIIDGDVLFNGLDNQFTTSGAVGRFDIQDVATHELGHFLGLDHSGCAGASLYPFVDPQIILHRSLSIDDARGLQHIYPAGSFARIAGTVVRASNGSAVRGAWVCARDSGGRLAGAVLSGGVGDFTLQSLDPGTYTVYATPLDFPVSAANLGPGRVIDVDFQSTVLGTAVVGAGGLAQMGALAVGPDVTLSLGRLTDDYPLRAITGQGSSYLVRGAGLNAGSTLSASDPAITLSSLTWMGSAVAFTASVPAGAAPGHVDLTVTNASGDVSILCGAIEVTPPDPLVSLVSPGTGDSDGGTALTITGSNFGPGLRVVIGDRIYPDGAPGGSTVIDSNTIQLTTKNMVPGTHDVVVIDATGVEGRGVGAFQATAVPRIDAVFPSTGSSVGGTVVTLTGDDFVAGATVLIDGVPQTNVTVTGLTQILIVTEPGVPGGPYTLSVQNPGGGGAAATFSFASKPDPAITSVSPNVGTSAGGNTLTITGANFTAQSQVVFGAHPLTGVGGSAAAQVTLVDSGTLTVVTPASTSTRSTVLVREADTGQADLLDGAFVFQVSSGGGGGGGGCGSLAPSGPPDLKSALAGAGWMVLLLGILMLRARRHPAAELS